MSPSRALLLSLLALTAGCELSPSDAAKTTFPVTSTGTGGAGGASTGTGGAEPVDPASTPIVCDSTFADAPYAGEPAKVPWARILPGNASGSSSVHLTVDPAGNTIFTNRFSKDIDFGGGVTMAKPADMVGEYMAKASPSGELLWAHDTSPYRTEVVIAGASGSFWTLGSIGGKKLDEVRRWDPSGNLSWAKEYNLQPRSFLPLAGHRIVVSFLVEDQPLEYGTGTLARSEGTSTDAALVAVDPLGEVVWARTFGSLIWPDAAPAEHQVTAFAFASTPGGGALVKVSSELGTGATSSTERGAAIVRLDAHGEPMWIRRFPGIDKFSTVRVIGGPEGQSILQISREEEHEPLDFGCGTITDARTVLLKLAPDGRSEWTRSFREGARFVFAGFDPQGDVMLSGFAVPPCDFGAGEIVPPIPVSTHGRLVVAKLGADGRHLRSEVVGGYMQPDSVNAHVPFVDAAGDLIIKGDQWYIDTGLGVGPQGGLWLYLAKIDL